MSTRGYTARSGGKFGNRGRGSERRFWGHLPNKKKNPSRSVQEGAASRTQLIHVTQPGRKRPDFLLAAALDGEPPGGVLYSPRPPEVIGAGTDKGASTSPFSPSRVRLTAGGLDPARPESYHMALPRVNGRSAALPKLI
jgi:hypothetical protein